MSQIAIPGRKFIYFSAVSAALRSLGSLNESSSGILPVIGADCPGFVPHVTIGSTLEASNVQVLSKMASGSLGSSAQSFVAVVQKFRSGAYSFP
jgi:hypothetical protein